MLLIDLLCLQMILVYLIDLSGASQSIRRLLSRILTRGKIESDKYQLKPFTCSLCMMWWIGLFYLIYYNELTLYNLLAVCVLSFLTTPTKDLLLRIRESLIKLINNDIKR